MGIRLSRKTVILGTALFALAVVSVFWLNRGPRTSDTNSFDNPPAIPADKAQSEGDAPARRESSSTSVAAPDTPSEAQLDAQESWERAHGYLSNEREYLKRMSEQDLADLIEQGDTRAMTTLAARKFTNDPETMMGLYRLAAVHGNTTGLVSAALAWTTPHVNENAATLRVSIGQNYFDNSPSPWGQELDEENPTLTTCGR